MGTLYRVEIIELAADKRDAGREMGRIHRRWEKLKVQSVALVMSGQAITGRPFVDSKCVSIRVVGSDIRATFETVDGTYDTTVTFPAVWFELPESIRLSALKKLHDKKEAMTRWAERQEALKEGRKLSDLKALADELGFVLTPAPLSDEVLEEPGDKALAEMKAKVPKSPEDGRILDLETVDPA